MTDKQNKLLGLLAVIPPKLSEAEALLNVESFSTEDLAIVAHRYENLCYMEVREAEWETGGVYGPEIVPGLHSTHIYSVMELLLRYGLDPNCVCDDENVMLSLQYVDNEYLAGDVLTLLLEYGGDIHLWIFPESLWSAIDFDMFDAAEDDGNRKHLTVLVHMWMVLVGYGARYKNPNRIKPVGNFQLENLKNHRAYDYCLTWRNQFHVDLHIFDRESSFEVVVVS